jgi:hypothetical protein
MQAPKIVLHRDGQPSLGFHGVLIAQAGRRRSGQIRWHVLRVYRTDDDPARFVVHTIRYSTESTERNLSSVEVIESLDDFGDRFGSKALGKIVCEQLKIDNAEEV